MQGFDIKSLKELLIIYLGFDDKAKLCGYSITVSSITTFK